MHLAALLVSAWVQLNGSDGQTIWLNTDHVVNIRTPRGMGAGHFPPGTRCLIFTVDSKYLAVTTPCDELKRQLDIPH